MAQVDPSLGLPRVLALHGSGTNATIFRAQCRTIMHSLADKLRFVFANASYLAAADPEVVNIYGTKGPFRSWFPPLTPIPGTVITVTSWTKIRGVIKDAMREDDELGATGEWVGLVGFSQGSRLALSLLWAKQERDLWPGSREPMEGWRFAVLFAGRGGIVEAKGEETEVRTMRLPTLHVSGLQDFALEGQREWRGKYCPEGTWKLVEFDGGHRVPLKSEDADPVIVKFKELLQETGVTQ